MEALVRHYRGVLSEALAADAAEELTEVQHQLMVLVPPPGADPLPADRLVQQALKAQVSPLVLGDVTGPSADYSLSEWP